MSGHFFSWTIVVAIVIFVAREFADAPKRGGIAERKARAVKALVAAELERNNWVISSLRRIFTDLQETLPSQATLHLEILQSGQAYLTVTDEQRHSGCPVFPVQKLVLEQKLESFAEIEDSIFRIAMASFDALQELEHVRQSFIDIAVKATESGTGSPDIHFEGFLDYALKELEVVQTELARLYLKCTGNKFDKHRIR